MTPVPWKLPHFNRRQPRCLFNSLFRLTLKKTSNLHIAGSSAVRGHLSQPTIRQRCGTHFHIMPLMHSKSYVMFTVYQYTSWVAVYMFHRIYNCYDLWEINCKPSMVISYMSCHRWFLLHFTLILAHFIQVYSNETFSFDSVNSIVPFKRLWGDTAR